MKTAHSLPASIEEQYTIAVERTGETAQLRQARQRIAHLLEIGPEGVEALSQLRYLMLI